MEQVLCQASQRDLGDEDIGQGSAKANKFVYVTIEQGGDQPSIIGSFSADGRFPTDCSNASLSYSILGVSMAVVPGVVN